MGINRITTERSAAKIIFGIGDVPGWPQYDDCIEGGSIEQVDFSIVKEE